MSLEKKVEVKFLLWELKILIKKASTMKLSTHLIWQALMLVAQYGNQAASFVPGKYKPLVAIAIGAIQGILAWKAHYSNPDGTPASVAYLPKSK